MRALWNSCVAFGVAIFATACFDEDKLTEPVQTFALLARKDHTSVHFTEGVHQFPKDTRFRIPARIEVLDGNAGNHKSHLFFKKQKDTKENSCEYRGGSSQAEPEGKKELDKAKIYHFVECDNGMKAEEVATAQDLRLRVEDGGASKVSNYTLVKAAISYETAAPPTRRSTPSLLPTLDILAGLPPDPGDAGEATLLGIDSDNDGVRDDVQRWIFQKHPDSERKRAAVLQVARTMQVKLKTTDNKEESRLATSRYLSSISCAEFTFGYADGSIAADEVIPIMLNTRERNQANNKASQNFSGSVYALPMDGKATCDANPDGMRN